MDFTRTFKIVRDNSGNFGFRIPPNDKPSYNAVLEKCIKARNGWATIKITLPRRYKSTGKSSQNSHFHGHCAQIALETGHSAAYIKEWCKSLAVDKGYPQATTDKGVKLFDRHADPIGMTFGNATVEEAKMCIDVSHELAIDLGIKLYEGEE
jgi:hypothetical protein